MRKFLVGWIIGCFVGITNLAIADAPDTLWTKTYGGTGKDWGRSVQQTTDGGYIIAGYTESYGEGDRDMWVIKTDSLGNKQWDKTFGGILDDEGCAVRQTSDGGYIITGEMWSSNANSQNVWLIKLDGVGNSQWKHGLGRDWNYDDRGYSVQQTSDGGYIIAGYTASPGDVWLIKIDDAGDKQWDKTFGESGTDGGHSVQQTTDGGYIITGYNYASVEGYSDVWLIKTDEDGNKLWDKKFGGTKGDIGYSVQQTTDGGYIITGYTVSYGAGQCDVWLIKTDAAGNKLWDKTFGGSYDDIGYSVQQTTDGGYIITGRTTSQQGSDVWLIKTDGNGNKQWDKTVGGTATECGNSVKQTSDGGFIIAGRTYSFGAGYVDVYLIKVGPEVGVEERDCFADTRNDRLEIYPNPSFGNTLIKYGLPEKASISLRLYDISGRLVKAIYSGTQEKGYYKVDIKQDELKGGIYFIRFEANDFKATRKLTIIR